MRNWQDCRRAALRPRFPGFVAEGQLLPDVKFLLLFAINLLARTGYQIGKSPVLPVLAIGIGASNALLGIIVVVSTTTGIFLKPLSGYLADRFGRYPLLVAGVAALIIPCLLYQFVETPAQLIGLRLIHGVSTAILGPVMLSLLLSDAGPRRAERFGWFSLSRQGSVIFGPLLGGVMLAVLQPSEVYLIAGVIAGMALVPMLALRPHVAASQCAPRKIPKPPQGVQPVSNRAVIFTAGVFEMTTFLALYFYKAFLPIFALRSGASTVDVGLFLAIQELVAAALRPFTGKLADQFGYPPVLAVGLLSMGATLIAVPMFLGEGQYILLAVILGANLAVVQPALLALISHTGQNRPTLIFGIVGAFRNAGKVLGPVLGSALLLVSSPETAFLVIGLIAASLGAAAGLINANIPRFEHFYPRQRPVKAMKSAPELSTVRSATKSHRTAGSKS